MWLQYQALWDMDIGNVYNRLGEDLSKWMKVLKEIKYVGIMMILK